MFQHKSMNVLEEAAGPNGVRLSQVYNSASGWNKRWWSKQATDKGFMCTIPHGSHVTVGLSEYIHSGEDHHGEMNMGSVEGAESGDWRIYLDTKSYTDGAIHLSHFKKIMALGVHTDQLILYWEVNIELTYS